MLSGRKSIMSFNQDNELETLTQQAVNAAEAGQWDQVTSLYERRGQVLSSTQVSPSLAQRLLKWDRAVQARIQLVQAATHQNILEIQERRRKLLQLKQSWIHSSDHISRFSHAV